MGGRLYARRPFRPKKQKIWTERSVNQGWKAQGDAALAHFGVVELSESICRIAVVSV
jgi:hypothetical protein